MFTKRICGAAFLVTAALACASNPSSSAGPTPAATPAATAPRNPDVITAEELTNPSVSTGSVLDAVRRLRPNFLMTRGSTSIQNSSAGSVHISLDGGPLQAVSTLSNLRASEVVEIRYLSASAATQRFGVAAGSGGVILVKSK